MRVMPRKSTAGAYFGPRVGTLVILTLPTFVSISHGPLHHFRCNLIKLETNLKQLNLNLKQQNTEYSVHVI